MFFHQDKQPATQSRQPAEPSRSAAPGDADLAQVLNNSARVAAQQRLATALNHRPRAAVQAKLIQAVSSPVPLPYAMDGQSLTDEEEMLQTQPAVQREGMLDDEDLMQPKGAVQRREAGETAVRSDDLQMYSIAQRQGTLAAKLDGPAGGVGLTAADPAMTAQATLDATLNRSTRLTAQRRLAGALNQSPGAVAQRHLAQLMSRAGTAPPLQARAAAGSPVQLLAVTIKKEHLQTEEDIETDTNKLDKVQARAIVDHRDDYTAEQVQAAERRLSVLEGSQGRRVGGTPGRRPPTKKQREKPEKSPESSARIENDRSPAPNAIKLSDLPRGKTQGLGRIKTTRTIAPDRIPIELEPIVVPAGTVILKLVQVQPNDALDTPVMETDFAFVPNDTVLHPDAIRTVVMFRIVEDNKAYKYPSDSDLAPLNEMMTDEDMQTGVEEGWVVDIDPGVYTPAFGDLTRRDYRRKSSTDPVVTPFYGDSGTATEYRYATDDKAGYVDTPSFKPEPGGVVTFHYQVVLTDTQGRGSSVGAPLATVTWSFDITTDSQGLTKIRNVRAPQAAAGGGGPLEKARFHAAINKFDYYYRNPFPNPWAVRRPQLPADVIAVLNGARQGQLDRAFWHSMEGAIAQLAGSRQMLRLLLSFLYSVNPEILSELRKKYLEEFDLVVGYPGRDEDTQRMVLGLIEEVIGEFRANRPRFLE